MENQTALLPRCRATLRTALGYTPELSPNRRDLRI